MKIGKSDGKGRGRRSIPMGVPMPAEGIYILESHHSPSFRMAKGSWPFHKICWVPVGRGFLEFEDGRVVLGTNSFAVIPMGYEHRFVDDPSEPMTLIIACVTVASLEGAEALRLLFETLIERFPRNKAVRARSAYHFSLMRDSFQGMLREQSRGGQGHTAMLHALLMQLVVAMVRGAEAGGENAGGSEAALEGLLDELENRFDRPVTLDDLAERCGVSPRRFTQLFKSRTGYTLVEYVNRKRIEYAKERLRETGHVAYACHESGFQDLAYFYRSFKRYVGCTPGEYLRGMVQ
ncbi:helix-turn-helix domain-containing protein [Pelagicoccus sp. SDUM812002]|uniref:helix-turn-helix transcriptional regulator n=1 Tax=Pelagicoccus sp. SDUM812002 TaxID=3041266 RepID=UPI00280DF5A1|nr:helix-turn-helix domain-containing protein [Pelagicoccus sp. SDUM812002]MDQ8188420.1 helix-turn-helix domain-containing protein [Pelagicoccus sp. SDUM812002]